MIIDFKMKNTFSLFAILSLFIISCDSSKNNESLEKEDEETIRMMISTYNKAWLQNDSSAILNLFSDSAILIPSGLTPIKGRDQIVKFWWPNDSSITKINSYSIHLMEVEGTKDLAYTYENGKLSWSYEKGTFKMSKDQESFEITIFKRTPAGWKITKRIWTDLKKQ
jgi:ketosteroid isomerase-like protein